MTNTGQAKATEAYIVFDKKVYEAIEGQEKNIVVSLEDPNGLVTLEDLQNNVTEVRLSSSSVFGEGTAKAIDFELEEGGGSCSNPGFKINWEEFEGGIKGKAVIKTIKDDEEEETELKLLYIYRSIDLAGKIARKNYSRKDKAVFVLPEIVKFQGRVSQALPTFLSLWPEIVIF